jgi:hypothetical protein
MSLDFLRRLAFDGELSGFIRDDPYQFAERATGVGLRFEPDFLADVASNAREEYVGVRTNWHQRADFGAILARAVDEIWSGDDRALARYRSYYYAGDKPKDRRSIVHIVVDLPTEGDPLLVDGPSPTRASRYAIASRARSRRSTAAAAPSRPAPRAARSRCSCTILKPCARSP